jgi:hypothetical protein
LATGSSTELILADRVPLLHWRELTAIVRVHSHTMTGSNSIELLFYAQSWTAEDPGLQFIGTGVPAPQITSSTPSPGMIVKALPLLGSNAIGDMIRITALGSRSGAGTMQANVTVQFSAKNV